MAPCWERQGGGLSCMHVREDRALRRGAQEGEEVRRREERWDEQRWDGWRNWRGEWMESFHTCGLCCAGEGESGTEWPLFWRGRDEVMEVETGDSEISRAVKDTSI